MSACCRDYGIASRTPCTIQGNPDQGTITGGLTLPSAICTCSGTGQCDAISSSSFSTYATGLGSATLSGALSAAPFSNIVNQTCFAPSSLGTSTDTYRVCGLVSLALAHAEVSMLMWPSLLWHCIRPCRQVCMLLCLSLFRNIPPATQTMPCCVPAQAWCSNVLRWMSAAAAHQLQPGTAVLCHAGLHDS